MNNPSRERREACSLHSNFHGSLSLIWFQLHLSRSIILSNHKFKLQGAIPKVIMRVVAILGGLAVAVLFFFSLIFALASAYDSQRLITSLILFSMGLAIAGLLYYMMRKPKTVVQRLEVSGQMKAASIKCPTCSASVDADRIRIVSGVPYATCSYCGSTFEVIEEPKW